MLLNTPNPFSHLLLFFFSPESQEIDTALLAGGVNAISATFFFFFCFFLRLLFGVPGRTLTEVTRGGGAVGGGPIAPVSSAFPKQISGSDLVPTYTYHQKNPSTWQSTIQWTVLLDNLVGLEAETKQTPIGFLFMEWPFSVCFTLAFLKSKVFILQMSA